MKRDNCFCCGPLFGGLVAVCGLFTGTLCAANVDFWQLGLASAAAGICLGFYCLGQSKVRRLKRSNQELITWVGGISHDLMAPLGAIQGYAEILDELLDTKCQLETRLPYAKAILDLGMRLEGMSRDLAVITATDAQRTKEPPQTASLAALVDRVLAIYRLPSTDPQRIHFSISAPSTQIDCRPHLVERAIQNLLQNADRYSPNSTPITIEIRRKGSLVLLRITNDVEGEGPLPWDRLFQAQQRGVGEKIRGSGLGLSIVRKIMDLHGGAVEVETIGKQISFQLSFPVSPATAAWIPLG